MSTKPYLSVVIPSYNEMENLKNNVLENVVNYLKKQNYTWEVILTDDGSEDGTLKKLHQFAKKHPQVNVLENIHAGKGPTVKSGMLAAKGQWRLFTDFDQSTPLAEIEKLWLRAKQNHEVVIGSREMVGSVRDEEPWYRHLMGRGFNALVQILAIPGILDTQCGFKLFSDHATELLFNQLHVYGQQEQRGDAFTGAFDVELLFIAKKNGLKISEVPIEWHHHETDRVDPIKDSLRMLKDIIRIRIADFKGKYKKDV
ncbi:MAG: glycosyltransferase family 2 protein [Candidatus Pacebacteria bacterium]|jgi:dolichyl-phosphate beta-glucosyltransferase|nr:glycosyltransferase family 2 protein [Candidatus Paceibacterota bacterium]MBT3512214.1 glycosyltransferase family 2 protein [Candidatus Paceibacterota bacterium]MBT4004556.1 glycosyltransferase family 2 protein [Candidatus Paceibacterota bacterium]MBT4359196.1 glycosyltransferase family 2 protein [Candidatus Paceibacterota bacterium]MBT4681082.1 glycosyltransferase family 2 protein [Candidatus Paceibacterota bacterium]